MKKLFSAFAVLLLLFSLQGCVPAVFVAGATIGVATGEIINDKRTPKTILDDQSITHDIQMRLTQDNRFTVAHISVASYNRIVLLVGQTPTQELRDAADTIAKANPKVRIVHNEITVEYPTKMSTRAEDTWITTEIKAVLVAKPGLKSSQVKIITENGTVYLMGLISRNNADIVTEQARKIDGVQKVVKLFEYI